MAKSSVFIVDDHPVVAQGLRRVLASTEDMFVIGSSTSGPDAMMDLQRLQPDLVLLDLRIGDHSGVELCRRITGLLPDTRVAILTAFDDTSPLGVCLEVGARAVMLKSSSELDIVATLRRVRDGEIVIDPAIFPAMTKAAERDHVDNVDGELYERLRPREHEVLRLLANGRSTREIAAQLDISVNTVRGYMQALMTKLHVHSRVQLVITARRLRLV